MKKILMFSIILGVMLMSVGLVVADNQDRTIQEGTRYLIKSNNAALKAMFGVRHNFDRGFTTDLSPGQLRVLEKFGVEVEEVAIYSITARPTCNYNDICEPEEGENPSCADCKSIVEDPEPTVCGDGVCEGDETTESCPADCPAEPEPPVEERICEPSTQIPWGIERVQGGIGGTGITVAVLDTGVDRDHPDLVENIVNCLTFGYRSCNDDNGHGTHVSGTILANGGSDDLGIVGVAPEAKLMAIKVLDRKGRGYTDDIAEGIRYAADNSANIISMSLGGSTESLLMKDAIDYAVSKGVLVIASAGNSGPALDSIGYPAANPNVVAVAAFDVNNDIADFSSRGLNDGDWVIEAREIEFAAPGVSVLSTYNNGCYATGSGTSMAAPHIAGIAARDWTGTADGTRVYLQDLAKIGYDYGLSGDDIEAGLGLPIAL